MTSLTKIKKLFKIALISRKKKQEMCSILPSNFKVSGRHNNFTVFKIKKVSFTDTLFQIKNKVYTLCSPAWAAQGIYQRADFFSRFKNHRCSSK